MTVRLPAFSTTGPDSTGLTGSSSGSRRRGSRLVALLAVMALLAAGLAVPATSAIGPAAPAGASDVFSDVADTNPFHDEITWFAERGFTTGYPDGTYKPGRPVTRQAIAAQLHRLWLALGNTDPDPLPDPGFTDVAPGDPFYDDIAWLAAVDLTNGYPDGSFRPGAPITRQAIAALIHRLWALLGQYEADIANTAFTDVGPTHPFRSDIDWFATMSIGQGWPDGTYRPGAAVTRQATAAFIMRLAAQLGLFPDDYNRDGKADYGYIDSGPPGEGAPWYTLGNAEPIFTPTVTAGGNPLLPGDYDGDGWTEPASEKNGIWETAGDRGTFTFDPEVFDPGGDHSQMIPVPGNYDGSDPQWEAAYFDEITANWWIEGFPGPIQFGIGSNGAVLTGPPEDLWWDAPAPADYSGDGLTEIAVYHLGDGTTRTYDGPVPPTTEPSAIDPAKLTLSPSDIGGIIVGDAELGFPMAGDLNGDLAMEAINLDGGYGWFIGTGPALPLTLPSGTQLWAIADFDGNFSVDLAFFLEDGGVEHADGTVVPYPDAAGKTNIHLPTWEIANIIRLTFIQSNCYWNENPVCPPGINPPPPFPPP